MRRSIVSFGSVVLAAAALVAGAPALAGGTPREEEEKLITVLRSDAALFDKAKACQRLAVIGSRESVPVLAGLLADEKLSHYARFGLEPIPDPSVDAALREAMGKLKGKLLVGVINSIGVRRDAGALEGLKGLLVDPDREVAKAAVAAVGRIGTPDAARLLKRALAAVPPELRPAVADACLIGAEVALARGGREEAAALYDAVRQADVAPHLRAAALRGEILSRGEAGVRLVLEALKGSDPAAFAVALGLAREMPGSEVTRALVESLEGLPGERRPAVIAALGDRGDRTALPAVLRAAGEGPEDVRLAGVRALSRLGNASAVPVLLSAASRGEGELARLAMGSLEALSGKEVDEAIADLLARAEAGDRAVLIDLAGRRSIALAVPALMKAADDEDGRIRTAALKALGSTIGIKDLAILIARAVRPREPGEAPAAQEALRTAAKRIPDKDTCAAKLLESAAGAPVDARCRILEVLGAVGGAKAVHAVAASARDPDGTIRSAARKVLAEWPNEDAAPELLGLVKESEAQGERMPLLYGFSRIVSRVRFPKEERLALCQKALAVARNDDERRLVLATLAAIPAVETIPLLTVHLGDPALKEDACTALVTISDRVVRFQPKDVAEAMKKVLETTKQKELADRARKLLEQAGGRP